MSTLPDLASAELVEANDLINRACAEVQRMLEPVEGYVPKSNLQAALHLLGEVFAAKRHLDKANYELVTHILSWAKPEVPA